MQRALIAVLFSTACDRSGSEAETPAIVAWPVWCADEPDASAIPDRPATGELPGATFAGRTATFGGCAPGHETAGASWVTLQGEGGVEVEVRFGANGNAPGTYVLGGPRRAGGFEAVEVRRGSDVARLDDSLRGVIVLHEVDPPHGKIGLCARAADGRMQGIAGTF